MNAPAIKVTDLRKSYRHTPVLRGIDLEVAQDEILAFMGPNGAGKTTAINILTGLLRPDGGEVCYHGQRFDPQNLTQKKILGVVPQNNNLERDLSVEDNLKIHGFLFGLGGRELDKKIDEVLEIVDLQDRKNTVAGQLSGGMKRRLVIARALMHDPRILFLDEPSSGLDPATRRRIHTLVRKLNRHSGVCVFLTTHYIEEADSLASRVVFISQGSVVATGCPAELKAGIGRYAVEYALEDAYKTLYFDNLQDAQAEVLKLTIPEQSSNGQTDNSQTDNGRISDGQAADGALPGAEPRKAPGKAAEADRCAQEVRIREVSLEDTYIRLTGRKMQE